jgi:hypothetical protein
MKTTKTKKKPLQPFYTVALTDIHGEVYEVLADTFNNEEEAVAYCTDLIINNSFIIMKPFAIYTQQSSFIRSEP